MTKKGIVTLLLLLVVIVAALAIMFSKYPYSPARNISVGSFEECVNAGYPVMESYPRQCRAPSGEVFVEIVAEPISKPDPGSPVTPGVKGNCYVGGCSGQICSDQKDTVSTCEFREEYACYKTAKCEWQTNGQCGWTQTPQLAACLDNPPGL